MRRFVWVAGLMLAGWLSGCFDQKSLLKIIPEEEDRQARRFLELVRDDRMSAAREMLRVSQNETEVTQGLATLHTLFIQSKWVELETIGYNKAWNAATGAPSTTTVRLDYQIQMEKHWAAGTVIMQEHSGVWKITSARFNPLSASLETIHAFSFSGKNPAYYALLLLGCLVPAFSIVTLIVCIKSPVRRKWLWILFILLPVGKLSLNWSTGEWSAQVLAFQLLGVSMFKTGLYAPWILGVSFPLGAAWFLLRRKSLAPAPAIAVPPPLAQ